MSASLVQDPGKFIVAGTASVAKSFATLPVLGNYNIVGVSMGRAAASAISVTDNQGHTYTKAVESPTIGTGINTASIWFAKVTTSSGTFTVTVSNNGAAGSSFIAADIAEWSGLAASDVLDQTNSANTTTSPDVLATGDITTTRESELLVAVLCSNSSGTRIITPPGDPWTQRWVHLAGATGEVGDGEDRIVLAKGTYSATWSIDANAAQLTACIASFKVARMSRPGMV